MTNKSAIKILESLYKQCEKFEMEIRGNSIWNLNPGVNAPLFIDKSDAPWREFEIEAQHYIQKLPTHAHEKEFVRLLERSEINLQALADLKVILKRIMLDLESPLEIENDETDNVKVGNNYTLNITAPVSNLQIQQGTTNSSQTFASSKDFDYDEITRFLERIRKYPLTDEEFGDNTAKIKQVVSETERAVEAKESPSKIKALLETLRELTIGISGSLIASGIASNIPTLIQHLNV